MVQKNICFYVFSVLVDFFRQRTCFFVVGAGADCTLYTNIFLGGIVLVSLFFGVDVFVLNNIFFFFGGVDRFLNKSFA